MFPIIWNIIGTNKVLFLIYRFIHIYPTINAYIICDIESWKNANIKVVIKIEDFILLNDFTLLI